MTDERRNWYNLILAAPLDDTLRLAFADWLGEHGSGDRDAATVEFIRVACRRGENVMPRAAYAWIGEHWRRLIPHALTALPDHRHVYQQGRTIRMDWQLPERKRLKGIVVCLHFARGFLNRVDEWSHYARGRLLPALYADQPLAAKLGAAETNARRGLVPLRPPTVDE